jgi:aminomethyltransferase
MVVVNAANIAKDFAWMNEHVPADVKLEDRSDQTALLALQGPRAVEVLRGHVPDPALELGFYRFMTGRLFGVDAILSRTGYTGEDGFELYFHVNDAVPVWEGLMKAGAPHGLEPVGLGARDTLRLEMGYMLYGNDIDDSTHPLEAGIGWTVKLDRGDFIGRDALLRIKQEGLKRRLVGITSDGRRVPRHAMVIESAGRPIGQVTSGTFSPTLERAIAMAYVETGCTAIDTAFEVVSGTTRIPARVTKKPFHTGGSHK